MSDVAGLVAIGVVWCMGLRVGYVLVTGCGVAEPAARWSLACMVPTAGLVFSVHVVAAASMVSGDGWLAPWAVCATFAIVCAACWGVVGRRVPDGAAGRGAGLRLGVWWVPVCVVGGMYGVFLLDAMTGYPSGYDALHYHLPSAVRWMQERAIRMVPGVAFTAFPENGMIVPCLLAFSKWERLMQLAHVPTGLAMGVTVFALVRALGVKPPGAAVGSCVALSIPMVVFQSFDGYIDLYAGAAWLAALLGVMLATRAADARSRQRLLVLAGLAAGVALGAKTTYLVMTAMLMVMVAGGAWLGPGRSRCLSATPVRHVLVFGLAAGVCSCFWFVRAARATGNPVYPIEVQVAGHVVFPSDIDVSAWYPDRSVARRVSRWWDYPWRESKHSGGGPNPGYPYSRNNGLGAAYAALVPVGLVAVAVGGLPGGRRREEQRWRVVCVVVAVCGIVLVLTVFREMLRFALGPVLVGVPVAAVLADRLIDRFPRCMLVTSTCALVVTAAVASVVPARRFLGRVRDGRWDRVWAYQLPPLVDDLPPGARVLNLSEPDRCYPLLGRELEHDVISPAHWRVLLRGETMTGAALYEHAIDYIYVQAPWPQDWPADLPVEKIYDDTETRALATTRPARVYRVMPPRPAAAAAPDTRTASAHDPSAG
ncbi:MAG: hypothetical protein ACE5E6_06990 [Phycisphaerae bacterium]